jgi:uncharacterized membrane protein
MAWSSDRAVAAAAILVEEKAKAGRPRQSRSNRPRQKLYKLWRDFTKLLRFEDKVVFVEPLDERRCAARYMHPPTGEPNGPPSL